MQIDEDLKLLLKKELVVDEGLRIKPYKDTKGIWTWGVGRNLENNPLTLTELLNLLENGIDSGIEFCLENDIDSCFNSISKFNWFLDCSLERKLVLMNMCFNLGIKRLLTFQKMINALNAKDYSRAADEILDSKAAKVDAPNRYKRLADRMRAG